MPRSRPGLFLALILSITLSVAQMPVAERAIALQGDRRPDLQMVQIRDWHLQASGGRRLLRFTTIFVNAGPGPFELRASRSSAGDPTMDIAQVMYRWDGSTPRRIATDGIARYAGDGHDHWHVQDVVTYEAWKVADPTNARRGAKTGFCFFDTTPWRLSLPYARQRAYYQQEWCGTRSALTNRVGVSVGWGDVYPWDFAYQWIDVTGLPGGIYRVRATVDIQDFYQETDDFDNCVWTEIRIPAPGSSRPLEVLRNGNGCGPDAMTAATTFPQGTTFQPDRAVRIAAGVHVGWQFNSQGTQLRKLWQNLAAPRSATTSVRAIPPGATNPWLYMTSGPYSGYWLKEGADVRLEP